MGKIAPRRAGSRKTGITSGFWKNDQVRAHLLQHFDSFAGQPSKFCIVPRSKMFREDVLRKGSPSAGRLIADKELSFLPAVQEIRLVVRDSFVRGQNFRIGRS